MSLLPTEGFYVFTIKELMKATNSFSSTLLIGEGSAGMVYKGQLPSGKLVAVKRILQDKKVSTFYQEVELLARVRHPNLTALLGYCQFKQMHLLVYEYMSNGDLSQKLLGRPLHLLFGALLQHIGSEDANSSELKEPNSRCSVVRFVR